jgi:hypothetical protein
MQTKWFSILGPQRATIKPRVAYVWGFIIAAGFFFAVFTFSRETGFA